MECYFSCVFVHFLPILDALLVHKNTCMLQQQGAVMFEHQFLRFVCYSTIQDSIRRVARDVSRIPSLGEALGILGG